MTNQVSFQGYFKREDIQELLNGNITQIYVTGTLNYTGDNSSWTEIKATGFGGSFVDPPSKEGCPRPCP